MRTLSTPRSIPGFDSTFATPCELRLHYWIGGPANGPPVVLWHGFLETGYAWRKVGYRLTNLGYSVLIPDMRGFGDSDKPAGNEGYDAAALADELHDLIENIGFGEGRAITIAAHDMGAPPALLYAAKFPKEVVGLIHIEGPVMVAEVLQKLIAYDRQAMAKGSMWWWILPLAPGVPERLIVGREREFLTWFYEIMSVNPVAVQEGLDEYLRSFKGEEGVLGAMGVYRAAFTSIDQTTPLMREKIRTPVIAVGGRKSLAEKQGEMVCLVASDVEAHVLEGGGHFLPEECDEEIAGLVDALASRQTQSAHRN